MIIWNPWHGCHKISEGCEHCYMYFLDGKRGFDTAKVFRTENFAMPLQRKRDGSFKYPSGWRCMWDLARIFCGGSWCLERRSLENHQESSGYGISSAHQACASHLGMLAKGLGNWLWECSSLGNYREPEESRWEASYSFGSSSQAQRLHGSSIHWSHRCFFLFSHRADRRCTMWGENYDGARPCHYEWVKSLSDQCRTFHVSFNFIETGTCFVKDGRIYRIHDKQVQSKQAYLSGLSFQGKPISYKLHLPEGNLFGNEIIKPQALFRAHCKTCGSRMTCNGCSYCGACDNR